mgnify:FL=1
MKYQEVTENLEKVFYKQLKENYKKKQEQLILELNQYVCILLKERHEQMKILMMKLSECYLLQTLTHLRNYIVRLRRY